MYQYINVPIYQCNKKKVSYNMQSIVKPLSKQLDE